MSGSEARRPSRPWSRTQCKHPGGRRAYRRPRPDLPFPRSLVHSAATSEPLTASASIFRHFAWSALRTWGERLTSLLVFVVLSRLLPPADIGALAYVGAFLFFAQTFAEGALGEWIVRQPATTAEEESSVFWTQVGLGALVGAVVAAGGLLAGEALLRRPDAAAITAWLALVVPLSAMERVPEALLRRGFRFDQLAVRTLMVSLAGGAVGIGLALAGFGVWCLVAKQLFEIVLRVALAFRLSGFRPRLRFRYALGREAIAFGGSVLASRLLDATSQRIDLVIVGSILGPVTLGYYAVAVRITQLIAEMTNGIIYTVAFQHFVACAGDLARTTALHRRLLSGTTLLAAPAIAVAAATAPLHMPLLFGPQWAPAVPAMQLLCLLPILGTVVVYFNCLLLANGAKRNAVLLSLASLASTVALTTAGTWWGLLGVAALQPVRGLVLLLLGARLARPVSAPGPAGYARALGPGLLAAGGAALAADQIMRLQTGLSPVLTLAMSLCGAAAIAGPIVFGVARTMVSGGLARPGSPSP
ncbi:lipopolysaccharide biosynthesis protein [Prosthecomicrobium sp. N25]|uniref:lipopolysaccharide biosynthesis protein n=1 Tax=Prosthecomicrobium sp. N25 TaxID=3129254 RepID=UPI0030781B75